MYKSTIIHGSRIVAELVRCPCLESIAHLRLRNIEHFARTIHGCRYVCRLQLGARYTASRSTAGRRAPVAIVDLK